jgi:GNAT superfamily N-acetyltransferase
MSQRFVVRQLAPHDRAAWEPLWVGYRTFYQSAAPAQNIDALWARLHDPMVPVHGLGAFDGERLLGITHYIFHHVTVAPDPRCYLNDLFTVEEARGRGVARALIEAVYAAARAASSSTVYWMTHETNTVAQALYDRVAEKSGFIQYRKVL